MSPKKPIIVTHNLCKSFGKKIAVNKLSLSVKQGEIFGFLGPNGSGKTTSIRMMCGLLTPDSGLGSCLGYDLKTQAKLIKRHVGYMAQHFSFYKDLTVAENLNFISKLYDLKNRQQAVKKCIGELSLTPYQNTLAGNLSGGWQQRLALAACLIHQPQLLLLDEPTAGVDPKARNDFWALINQLSERGITTLVSTHYIDEIARCTRLAYINQGKLMTEGTAKNIINNANLTTIEARGEQINQLHQQLKKAFKHEPITVLGDHLRISSQDGAGLRKALLPIKKNRQYKWRQVESNIEDVLGHFTQTTEKATT